MGNDNFSEEMNAILNDYGSEVDEKMEDAISRSMKESAKELKSHKSFSSRNSKRKGKRTGAYPSGWTSKVTKERLSVEGIVYNKNKPGLTHLLENGHVTRNGTGRTFAKTPAYPHIEPVNESAEENAVSYLKESL
jgi:hypothetical protein